MAQLSPLVMKVVRGPFLNTRITLCTTRPDSLFQAIISPGDGNDPPVIGSIKIRVPGFIAGNMLYPPAMTFIVFPSERSESPTSLIISLLSAALFIIQDFINYASVGAECEPVNLDSPA